MLRKKARKPKSTAWRWAWIYLGLIFISIPATPEVRSFLARFFSVQLLVNGSILAFGAGLILMATILRSRRHAFMAPYFLIWLGIIFLLMMLIELPIERVHIPEYGLLSILLFRGFRLSRRNSSDAYWLSFLWAAAAGGLDEFIQHLLPNRYFAWRDILLNVLGAFTGLSSYRFYEWVKKKPVTRKN